MTTPARVIVVDDDASIRDAIADCLLLHGYQVRVAADATALDVLLQVDRPATSSGGFLGEVRLEDVLEAAAA